MKRSKPAPAPISGPRLGERLMKRPFFGIDNITHPIPCTVVHVNARHGHYTVRVEAGYREAFRFGT